MVLVMLAGTFVVSRVLVTFVINLKKQYKVSRVLVVIFVKIVEKTIYRVSRVFVVTFVKIFKKAIFVFNSFAFIFRPL